MPRTSVAPLLQIVGLLTACSGPPPPRESDWYLSSCLPHTASASSVENAAAPATPPNYTLYKEHSIQALKAYEQKNFTEFLVQTQAAAAAAPDSPRALYNLACAHALNKDAAQAGKVLVRLAEKNVYFDISRDTDFDLIKTSNEFAAAQSRMEEVIKAVGTSAVAFTIPQKDLLTEGIAHDSKSGDYFVGSVHRRKIIRRSATGVTDFVKEGEHGLYAVFGMSVDTERGSLFACSSAVPEMNGYTDADKGKAALFEFDLTNGSVRRKVTLEEPGVEHNLNDLTIDPSSGDVYISNATAGGIYLLKAGAPSFLALLAPGRLVSPQGIALSPDKKYLYVADYPVGLYRVDLATKNLTYLNPPPGATLTGIDGLTYHNGGLIAIQNGSRPHRVTRLSLSADGSAVVSAQVLEQNHPLYNEPTLGVVVEKSLYYIANSQWGSFEKGAPKQVDQLSTPTVLSLPLK